MRPSRNNSCTLLKVTYVMLLISMALSTACQRASESPSPVPLEPIRAAVEKASPTVPSETRALVAGFEAQPGADDDQRLVQARPGLAVTSFLQSARGSANARSEAALKEYFARR